MKLKMMSLSLLIASVIVAHEPVLAQGAGSTATASAIASADPAQQVRDAAKYLRTNDLASLLRTVVPPADVAFMREAYELKRQTPTTDEDRAKFNEKFAKLIAPDAVDQLMLEIEPKLVTARPQAPGAILMGFGALQMAVNSPDSDLTPEQRTSLKLALPGIQQWASTTDFLSSDTLRQAITLVANAARATGVSNVDQLKMLSFEELLAKAGNMLAASKQAARIYGIDIDAILATTDVQVLDISGDKARVRATITVFDAPISAEHELELVDGRWYGKHARINIGVGDDLVDIDG